MYEITYAKAAAKFIKKLEKKDQERIVSVLERSRVRPEKHFERMVGEKVYKLRAGDYRIIADLVKNELRIFVIRVGHRKNVYD